MLSYSYILSYLVQFLFHIPILVLKLYTCVYTSLNYTIPNSPTRTLTLIYKNSSTYLFISFFAFFLSLMLPSSYYPYSIPNPHNLLLILIFPFLFHIFLFLSFFLFLYIFLFPIPCAILFLCPLHLITNYTLPIFTIKFLNPIQHPYIS